LGDGAIAIERSSCDAAIGSHHLAIIDEPIDRQIIDREIADASPVARVI
jgi:hypothetical protein